MNCREQTKKDIVLVPKGTQVYRKALLLGPLLLFINRMVTPASAEEGHGALDSWLDENRIYRSNMKKNGKSY